jgi:alkylhydroperoxidase/carboxymuconolactone decarboxylase family protein YurZ
MARTAPSVEEAFRRLTIGDLEFAAAIADRKGREISGTRLDSRTEALLRLGALVALDAPASSYRAVVAAALRAGARLEDLFAVLTAVAGEVGSAKVVAAAPSIALAAGYDVEADLE